MILWDSLDMLIDQYETVHMQDLDQILTLTDINVETCNDGYLLTGQEAKGFKTGTAALGQPLQAYVDSTGGNYAVMIRFQSDEIKGLSFICDSRFGRIMLDFSEGIYPAIDEYGESVGKLMLRQRWNNYIYTPGEWAYAFLSIANTGQKNCYVWAEHDAGNSNYHTSYGEDTGDGPMTFSIALSGENEAVTISDIWVFSFERMKR